MSRFDDCTSRALLAFTRGKPLPYRGLNATSETILVSSAKIREGMWVHPSRGSNYHLPATAAVAWEARGPVYGARWLCGGSSIGIRINDPAELEERWGHCLPPEAESFEDILCWKCRAVRDGSINQPVVYRFYDKHDQLLYIGSTKSLPSRLSSHRASTWWFPVVRRIEHEVYQSLEAARDAERDAIRAERPKMNIQHNRAVS